MVTIIKINKSRQQYVIFNTLILYSSDNIVLINFVSIVDIFKQQSPVPQPSYARPGFEHLFWTPFHTNLY